MKIDVPHLARFGPESGRSYCRTCAHRFEAAQHVLSEVMKTRKLSRKQLERLVKSLNVVYGNRGIEDMDKIMAVLDADSSGDIDDNEWVQNLKKLPGLNKVLSEDVTKSAGLSCTKIQI